MLASTLLFTSACGRHRHTGVPLASVPAIAPVIGAKEEGIASWYGHPYHGRPAANGEIYDMEKMTAAHRTLPFDTWVRVTNLANRRTVDVRITDRGPFVDGRIIDLSHAAARALDMIGPGIVRVQLEIISVRNALYSEGLYAVQVGAFQDRRRAEGVRAEMERRFGAAQVVPRDGEPPLWRVLVGRENGKDAGLALASRLGGECAGAFLVRLDDR